MVTSVAFPAFVLGHDPGMRVIVMSYGTDLAIKLSNAFAQLSTSCGFNYYSQCFAFHG
jgi:hypothetical protein